MIERRVEVTTPEGSMPDRVAAVASIQGAWMVRDGDDSPHLGLDTETLHGYAPPDGERYDLTASELHWERVHSLFRGRVQV
jgi:hypothetical protein